MNLNDRIINALQFREFQAQQSEHAQLPYTVDYASLLGADTIATSEWLTVGRVTISNATNTNTTATAILSGQPGRSVVINKITTAAGIVDERIIRLTITRNDTGLVEDYV